MTLILVRHGESEGNIRRIMQGQLDLPLTEAGREQARLVAARIASMPVSAIYSSPLSRAFETAEVIATHHALPVLPVEDLQEGGWGEAQGLTWTEVTARWQMTDNRPLAEVIPGAEAAGALRARAARAIDGLLDRHHEDVAVCVSHAGTIAQLIAHLIGMPDGHLPRMSTGNTAVTVVEGHSSEPVIRLLNDMCHLAGHIDPFHMTHARLRE
jgi:phosphoserine phosphatase